MLVLDRAHFDHMTGADRALQLEVLGLFRMQIDAWRAAFGAGESWRDAVHTMKGSARGIGLMALAEACESAEQAADADRADALQSVQAHLQDALAALEQFAAEAA
jgi:HPt (histidine-containing phosphotransfer) domain-containing protein